jgi:hypothetical protein
MMGEQEDGITIAAIKDRIKALLLIKERLIRE